MLTLQMTIIVLGFNDLHHACSQSGEAHSLMHRALRAISPSLSGSHYCSAQPYCLAISHLPSFITVHIPSGSRRLRACPSQETDATHVVTLPTQRLITVITHTDEHTHASISAASVAIAYLSDSKAPSPTFHSQAPAVEKITITIEHLQPLSSVNAYRP
jgi:hypothetical protein